MRNLKEQGRVILFIGTTKCCWILMSFDSEPIIEGIPMIR